MKRKFLTSFLMSIVVVLVTCFFAYGESTIDVPSWLRTDEGKAFWKDMTQSSMERREKIKQLIKDFTVKMEDPNTKKEDIYTSLAILRGITDEDIYKILVA